VFNPSREQVRRFFCESWRRHRERQILEGAEAVAADLIAAHPEYHVLLEDAQAALEREFSPEGGQANPFLHLSLHLAVAEQLSIDQPPGLKAAYLALRRTRDVHDAEHIVMECLAEVIWQAQRHGAPLDGEAYLACVRGKDGTSESFVIS
jgi:hypothetical protein